MAFKLAWLAWERESDWENTVEHSHYLESNEMKNKGKIWTLKWVWNWSKEAQIVDFALWKVSILWNLVSPGIDIKN